jgi:phosphoglycolate phosphatase
MNLKLFKKEGFVKEGIRADLIIFDLDGTLIDSTGDIAWAANRTLSSMGYDKVNTDTITSSIGWGVKSLLEKLMPEEETRRIDEARETFLKHYGGHLTVETRPYPGTLETLEYFNGKNKNMALVTNKPIGLTERIIEDLGMKGFFKMVLGGDSLEYKKPHPEPILKVMEGLDGDPEKTVFVGDSAIDCETARRAGVITIGAAYGFRGREELIEAGCGIIIENVGELMELVV